MDCKIAKTIKTGKIGILGLSSNSMHAEYILNKLKHKGLTKKEARDLLCKISFHHMAYQKFLEAQGLEVIHIDYHSKKEEITQIMDNLDGILLTGGGDSWPIDKININGFEYFKVADSTAQPYLAIIKAILDKAKSINDNGRFFSIFSVCLGFEAILLIETNYEFPIASVMNQNINCEITFKDKESRMKGVLTDKQRNDVESKKLLFFYHIFGFTEKDFNKFEVLKENYDITATVSVGEHRDCIASYEHKKYPFFGVQYHVEINMFDYSTPYKPNHSEEGYQYGLALGRLCVPKQAIDREDKVESDKYSYHCHIKENNIDLFVVSKDPQVKLLSD